jgi:hypothetical protein
MTATRRNVLKRGLAFVGGLVGLGAAGEATARERRPGSTLVLHAQHLERFSADGRAGEASAAGQRLTARGRLTDKPDGDSVGDVYVTTIELQGPAGPSKDARLESHTFRLRDGTIVGSGTAGATGGELAILGGTGRYAGARGSYIARHGVRGDGTAEFVLNLTT